MIVITILIVFYTGTQIAASRVFSQRHPPTAGALVQTLGLQSCHPLTGCRVSALASSKECRWLLFLTLILAPQFPLRVYFRPTVVDNHPAERRCACPDQSGLMHCEFIQTVPWTARCNDTGKGLF